MWNVEGFFVLGWVLFLFASRLYIIYRNSSLKVKIKSPGLPSFGKSPRPSSFSGSMNLNSFFCIYFDKMHEDSFLLIYLFWVALFTLLTPVVLITESDDLVFILLLIFLRFLSLHSWEFFLRTEVPCFISFIAILVL